MTTDARSRDAMIQKLVVFDLGGPQLSLSYLRLKGERRVNLGLMHRMRQSVNQSILILGPKAPQVSGSRQKRLIAESMPEFRCTYIDACHRGPHPSKRQIHARNKPAMHNFDVSTYIISYHYNESLGPKVSPTDADAEGRENHDTSMTLKEVGPSIGPERRKVRACLYVERSQRRVPPLSHECSFDPSSTRLGRSSRASRFP